MKTFYILLGTFIILSTASANPYPFKNLVPKDKPYNPKVSSLKTYTMDQMANEGKPVLRIQIDWDANKDQYSMSAVTIEQSGTEALYARSVKADPFGSFKGTLTADHETYFDSLGIGQEFRKLTRAITFRFPLPKTDRVAFEMKAENPNTGIVEKMLGVDFLISKTAKPIPKVFEDIEAIKVKVLKKANANDGKSHNLILNVYAEGYLAKNENKFWKDAQKVVDSFTESNLPNFDRIEIRAVFAPSNTVLGEAQDLGLPIAERDSFLGLYYPYWDNFGRWYHIVYPTREARFRNAIGQVPYDYPLALVDSNEYWGVGNYKELTAIPSDEDSFTYLLLHEFGHFLGLNEEYEGGGPTELAFSPNVDEPWSPNITFLRQGTYDSLKWKQFVDPATPIPTPRDQWVQWGPFFKPVYGAYLGGYADTEPLNHSHKPGFKCVMERYNDFCPVCKNALEGVINRDLGGN